MHASPPSGAQKSSHSGPVILLVEDESTVRDVTRALLESVGYRVLSSNNGEDALRRVALEGQRIDLLLTDLVMPGIHGAELAQHIHEISPTTATLFMSGYAQANVLQRIDFRRAHFIRKPFDMKGLLSEVAEILGSSAETPPLMKSPARRCIDSGTDPV